MTDDPIITQELHAITNQMRRRLRIIADAVMVLEKDTYQKCGGYVLKSILVTLAAYEGQPISMAGLSVRSGCSHSSTCAGTKILRRLGYIRVSCVGKVKTQGYSINWEALEAIATDEPLYRLGGIRIFRDDPRSVSNRARKRGARVKAAARRELAVAEVA